MLHQLKRLGAGVEQRNGPLSDEDIDYLSPAPNSTVTGIGWQEFPVHANDFDQIQRRVVPATRTTSSPRRRRAWPAR